MNDTQNKKIAQVTDKTLVVGVDIGSDTHYARAILARGYEVSKKPFNFENTREGFEKFVSWSYNLAAANQLTKIFVAVEPTGHYHQYYTTRKVNPLKKMQSLMAIAGKMTRIFYGMLKNGTEYDPAIVMKDLNKESAA